MLKFNTNVNLSIDSDSIVPLQYSNYSDVVCSTSIAYSVEIEVREWGIKNILFIAYDQDIVFNSSVFKDDENEYITIKLKLSNIEIQMPENITSGDIKPESIEVEITEIVQVSEGVFSGSGTAVLSFSAAN